MNTREGIRNSIAATNFFPRPYHQLPSKSKDDRTKVGGPPDGAPLPRGHRHVDQEVSVTLSTALVVGPKKSLIWGLACLLKFYHLQMLPDDLDDQV